MKKPYLVQRAEINVPISNFRGKRISEVLDLDYMGSSEFEWGAVPKSLRALGEAAEAGLTRLRTVNAIKQDDVSLRVYSFLTDEEFETYVGYLQKMRDGRVEFYLKEATRFEEAGRESTRFNNTNFWWDIENHVMWSFSKPLMSHLEESVKASLTYMNEQKVKRQ